MDIRKYFGGGGGGGKSALTEIRAKKGSPEPKKPKKDVASRSRMIKNPIKILSDSDSDDENPLPRSLQRSAAKGRRTRRIAISSDEDDLPPSASQTRPPKRSIDAPPKKNSVSPLKTQTKMTRKKEKPEISVVSSKSSTDDEIDTESDVSDDFARGPKPKKMRKNIPGQTKLKVERGLTTQKSSKSQPASISSLKKVPAAQFFKDFGKSPVVAEKISDDEQNFPQIPKRKSHVQKATPENIKSSSKAKERPEKVLIEFKKQTSTKLRRSGSSVESEVKELKQKKSVKSHKSKMDVKHLQEVSTENLHMAPKPEQSDSYTSGSYVPWVDKHKPVNIRHLVGQNGEKSPLNKLLKWLREWPKLHLGEGAKIKRARPPPWLAQSDGTSFKAVLLSGPPGVGKTSCAQLACAELGMRYIEKNASDARNKKILEDETSELIDCYQIDKYFQGKLQKIDRKSQELTHVLIMDEVDGMSGNNDRAGIAELIKMIKETRIPIICICNDRQSQKIRSLVNYCFDLRVHRPRVEQIRARLLTISCQEKLNMPKEQMDEIIEASNHDVRQSIYNLQLMSSGKNADPVHRKDVTVNPFEATRRLLSAETSLLDKLQMFFVDYSLMPLFTFENYPSIQNSRSSQLERLSALKKAADSISNGDIIDRSIRSSGAWSLLNEQAFFSSALPSTYMNGHLKAMINFPSWLGKNSTMNKQKRCLYQVTTHAYLKTFADSTAVVLNYVPHFRKKLCLPLLQRKEDGIRDVIDFYKEYNLIRDDSEAIADLSIWSGIDDLGNTIERKVKSALTRALNKEHFLLPYETDAVSKGRKKVGETGIDLELAVDEEGKQIVMDDFESEGSDSSDNEAAGSVVKVSKTNTASGGRGNAVRGRGRGGGRGRGSKPKGK